MQLTVKAKYCALPVVSLTQGFLVQVTHPMRLIPDIIELSHTESSNGVTLEEKIRDYLEYGLSEGMEVVQVDLIECDLLVPKDASSQ